MTQQTLLRTGTFTLDPDRTTIRCDCKAMFGLATVHGTFRLAGGHVQVGDDLAGCSASATIAAASFDSGLTARDEHVKSRSLLDVQAYPLITFASDAVRIDGDGWTLTGSVTAHGTTRPVSVRIGSVQADGDTLRFEAACTLDRTVFGVTKVRGRAGRTVHLVIDAVATAG